MTKELVIVESPAKARTLAKLLGGNYDIKASLGHVRDLPESRLGVDVKNNFSPAYEIPEGKVKIVEELKQAAKSAKAIYLATDPDREGEAISWHLVQAVDLNSIPTHRVVFHEITERAVKDAFRHPRIIDMKLVNAQQARRILDRLVGYRLSPLLWRKVQKGLSAGRVQTAALRMIVDREREIQAFKPEEYWTIEAELAKKNAPKRTPFKAALHSYAGKREKLEIHSEEESNRIVSDMEGALFSVAKVQRKEVSRSPAPPFTTSTLQQEAWRKLHFNAKRTMAIAQQLYEGLPIGKEGSVGLITYMRTDSTRVAASAKDEARSYISRQFGAQFLPPSPRTYAKKAKGAQEAHEAIRPTSVEREPVSLSSYLTPDQLKLYQLIWKRMVASQMANALLESTSIDIHSKSVKSRAVYLFRATGSVVKFSGFLILYSEGKDEAENEDGKGPLPELSKGDELDCQRIDPSQHFTQPPPRYTEATLVKAMEENGIGRPSTYAPTLATIQERNYVKRLEGRLHPSELGMIVSELLTKHFPDVFDLGFTAQMEEELDEIAHGKREWVPVLREFFTPFEKAVKTATVEMPRVKPKDEVTNEVCEKCGRPMVIKTGRYGRFLACSGFPACKNAKPILIKTGVVCPQCGGELIERRSKRGRIFYGCSKYPKCNFAVNQRPLPEPCPNCGGLLTVYGKWAVRCTKCEYKGRRKAEAKAEEAIA